MYLPGALHTIAALQASNNQKEHPQTPREDFKVAQLALCNFFYAAHVKRFIKLVYLGHRQCATLELALYSVAWRLF